MIKTKLINIIEANARLEYENFYDFNIDKIFISYYLPKEGRIDKRTQYLSIFGEEKKVLDGDGIFFVERAWKKWDSTFSLDRFIKVDDEHRFYSQVLDDLINAINECDYLIITGAMRNLATVFLKDILDIAKEKNIVITLLYCSPSRYQFYPEINKNQVKHYNQLVSRYKQVNFIHADFILYDFIEDLTANMITNITTAFIYNITSILVDMSKNNKIPNTVIYNTENINSMDDYYNSLVDMYRLITEDNITDNKTVLNDFFAKTIKVTQLKEPIQSNESINKNKTLLNKLIKFIKILISRSKFIS